MNAEDIYARQLERRVRDLEARLFLRTGPTGAAGLPGNSYRVDGTWGATFYNETTTPSNVSTEWLSIGLGPGEAITCWATVIGKSTDATYDYLSYGLNISALRGVVVPPGLPPPPNASVPGGGISTMWSVTTGGLAAAMSVPAGSSRAALTIAGKLAVPTQWRCWWRVLWV